MDSIGELAEGVADEHFPQSAIDPETLISRKKITLSFGDYGKAFDGMLEHKAGLFHIFCNIGHQRHVARVRFTLGHELGHFFIDDHRRALESGLPPHPSLSEYQSDNPAEREADHFASSLLMPKRRFLTAAKKMEHGMAAIMSLASQFDTSFTSTALRYVRLDVAALTVIKWDASGSYSWRIFSDSTYRSGFRKVVDRSAIVPPDSPTGKVLRGEHPGSKQYFTGTTVASQWFPFVSQGGHNDVLVTEQAISLGEYGALTIVFPTTGKFPMRDER